MADLSSQVIAAYSEGRRDFSYCQMQAIRMSQYVLTEIDLWGCNLADAHLADVDFRGSNLRGADLQRANLRRANLQRADLRGACLKGAQIEDANFQDAISNHQTEFPENFEPLRAGIYHLEAKSTLIDANLSRRDLGGIDLSHSDLAGAQLAESNLLGAWLVGVQLTEADLSNANLNSSNLSNANLQRAKFKGTNLIRANLTKATLFGVDLSHTNLKDSCLYGAVCDPATQWPEDFDWEWAGVYCLGPNQSLWAADLSNLVLIGVDLSGANHGVARRVRRATRRRSGSPARSTGASHPRCVSSGESGRRHRTTPLRWRARCRRRGRHVRGSSVRGPPRVRRGGAGAGGRGSRLLPGGSHRR
ncbi:MAG: pentapeptide repeat-containing protein [Leptolyngbya sp. SIO3F4]|nr:pentapeptide repeat-containing protein [Leptolyngbya sp. SIO3F4]